MRAIMNVRPGPNDDCWCGSGRKYKKCHQARDLVAELGGGVRTLAASPRAAALAGALAGAPTVRPGTITPMSSVPAHIPRPEYADSGRPRRRNANDRSNVIKTPEQIVRMRRACAAAREVLEVIKAAVRPGITTDAIDAICHQAYIDRGGYPSTLNYHRYPKSLCTSVNEVICHGIPDNRPLVDGDIVNLDVTIFLDGVHGDLSETVLVGNVDTASRDLVRVTHECLMRGIATVRPGSALREIGRAIQSHAHAHGYGVVRAFVGHGIGDQFHMWPQVPHYFDLRTEGECQPGMTFTIEPMINQGVPNHVVWDDQWTAVTADLKRSAQFEHTVLVTGRGVEILTLPKGEAQPFEG